MIKKKLIVVVAVTIAVVSGSIVYALHQKNSSSFDFQAYMPETLPSELVVTGRTVDIWDDRSNPFASKKILTYRFGASKGYISQTKKSDYTKRVVECDKNIANQTCSMQETPHGQVYKMVVTFSANQEFSSQTIRWFKDDTYIWMSLSNITNPLSEDEVNTIIDSFSPVTYATLPTKHYSPGP